MVSEEKHRSVKAGAALAVFAILAVVALYGGSKSFSPAGKALGASSSLHSAEHAVSQVISHAAIEQKSSNLYTTQGTFFPQYCS